MCLLTFSVERVDVNKSQRTPVSVAIQAAECDVTMTFVPYWRVLGQDPLL